MICKSDYNTGAAPEYSGITMKKPYPRRREIGQSRTPGNLKKKRCLILECATYFRGNCYVDL